MDNASCHGVCSKDVTIKKSNDGCKDGFIKYNPTRNPRYLNIKSNVMCCGNCKLWERLYEKH